MTARIIPLWDAGTVIDGATYHVELIRDGSQVDVLTPEAARDLCQALEDAAFEPPVCMRSGCEDYAIGGDLCGTCWEARP